MQARILELIGLVQHRELTASLLDLNDQMNNQLLRFFKSTDFLRITRWLCRFERYKNNTSAERGAVKSPGSSDEAFSPDEVQIVSLICTNPRWLDEDKMLDEGKMLDEDNMLDYYNL